MPRLAFLACLLCAALLVACAAEKTPAAADAKAAADAAKAEVAADSTAAAETAPAETASLDAAAAAPDVADAVPDVADAVPPDAALADVATPADAAADSAPDAAAADAAAEVVADAVADAAPDVAPLTDAGIPDTKAADAAMDMGMGMDMSAPDQTAADAIGYEIPTSLDVGYLTAPDAVPIPFTATNVDVVGIAYACTVTNYQPKACGEPILLDPPKLPGFHVDLPNAITYADKPPSSGTHRPVWGNWGEYVFLPQQRWLHNLEHAGIALLYHPCAPKATVEALRALAKYLPPFDGGPPIWVLTPYPELPSTIAMVRWGHVYLAECVDPVKMIKWSVEKSGDSPEVESMQGGYNQGWIGGWP